MKILNIAGREVKVNIDKISQGVYKMHAENEEMKTILAFGMLNAKLMEIMETNLKKSIKKQFNPEVNELFKSRINSFCTECIKDISTGVYSCAKMVV